jgi:Zn-dependent protease
MNFSEMIQRVAISILPVLFAITMPEAARAYMARKCGDNSAYAAGRMTINPLPHIDPIGTILLPLVSIFAGGILFGWAKPLPLDFRAFKTRNDFIKVFAAGPLANIALAFFWGLVFKIATMMAGNSYAVPLAAMAQAGIFISAGLAIFNLLPIPPLDGGRIAVALLPQRYGEALASIEPYAFFVILLLVMTKLLSALMMPFVMLIVKIVALFFGI